MFLLCMMMSSLLAQSGRQSKSQFTIEQADSLFSASAWKNAVTAYEGILKEAPQNSAAWNKLGFCYHNLGDYNKALNSYNKSLEYKPATQLEAIIHSRLARVYALRNEKEKAFNSLENALKAGYKLAGELQDHKDFDALRGDARYSSFITRATTNAMPCLADKQFREFDFWIGEWDVYPNGANVIVGHSKIEMASGGCMILENWTAKGVVPNEGKSMNYVNPSTGKWEQLWIGSGGINQNNPQKFVNGVYSDNAMRFEFEQLTPQGSKQIGRFIFFNEGPDQVRQFNEVSSDGGKTWSTVYDLVYKRITN